MVFRYLMTSRSTPLQQDDDFRLQSDYEKYNVSLNLGYDFTEEDKIAFLGGYYQSKFGIPPLPQDTRHSNLNLAVSLFGNAIFSISQEKPEFLTRLFSRGRSILTNSTTI